MVSPVKYASYSAALFEQENPSLKDKGMVSPSSQLSMIPSPFEVAIADPSNLIVHFFLENSVTATVSGISLLSKHSSFPRDWASKSTMAWLLTTLGVLRLMSYWKSKTSHYAILPVRRGWWMSAFMGCDLVTKRIWWVEKYCFSLWDAWIITRHAFSILGYMLSVSLSVLFM